MGNLITNLWARVRRLAGSGKAGGLELSRDRETITQPLTIGRYSLIKELGRGGMGVVYLGQDPFIERLVAVKTSKTPPPSDRVEFDKFREAFFHEARAAGNLDHPNIVSVYDAAVENDQCYLIMEYVNGTTLKNFTRKKNLLSVERVVKVIYKCAQALEYAHQKGVVHRDIKPANIMISKSGEIKISDFGIAMVEGSKDTLMVGAVTASLSYASPEFLRLESPGPGSDIYSLGVVAYELLTGERPFTADTDVALFYKINNEEPDSVKTHRPDIPDSLEKVVSKALRKDPAERYQSGLQMAEELAASFGHMRFLEEEINFEKKFNAVKNIGFFKEFSTSELLQILKATQWLKYDAAVNIISEGETEDFFYILVTGEALVKKGGQRVSVMKSGDCFGEMALKGDLPRTATIQAVKDSIVMKIGAPFFEQTSLSTQLRFYKVFNRTLIKRLAHTTEAMVKSYN
ncbi:MAG: protein kinase [Deltaproteobacteria bacterium]|nr:protein kinase [Deltaproteobacteria bacterium]